MASAKVSLKLDAVKQIVATLYAEWKVDDKILVSDCVGGPWQRAHFSHVQDGKVVVFAGGKTSWTATRESTPPWYFFGKKV
jgi:hypothetical protein